MSIRASNLYVSRRIDTALRVMVTEGQTADGIAERMLTEKIEAESPGLLNLIDKCNDMYEALRADNKKLLDQWKEQRK